MPQHRLLLLLRAGKHHHVGLRLFILGSYHTRFGPQLRNDTYLEYEAFAKKDWFDFYPSENFILIASFDLHVLGTPPAFILSQDQTLMFKS